MITLRPAAERGHAKHDWLDTYHTFSFDSYYDPKHMGFRSLRVINEDRVAPGAGFPTHPHRDMEIITWVLEGALEHKDSMGTGSVIRPGEAQRMSAGTGVTHSEYNQSKSDPVHLLQVWILPSKKGIQPGYEQRAFPIGDALRLIAAPDGREGAVTIHQDAELYVARPAAGQRLNHRLQPNRHAWLQVARGRLKLSNKDMGAGDGAAVSGEEQLEIAVLEAAEILLFDLI